jgi:hypothetical protein
MGASQPAKRWDGDEAVAGSAGAEVFVPRMENLIAHARRPDWVAEDPETHLWPHLQRAIDTVGSPWRRPRMSTEANGSLLIELDYAAPSMDRPRAALRAAALALIGSIAEETTYIEIVGDAGGTVIDVITGSMDDQTTFLPHGHTLRIRIRAQTA